MSAPGAGFARVVFVAAGLTGWKPMLDGAALDLVWLVLFVIAWVRLGRGAAAPPAGAAER
jgi:hypothetical protein